MRLPDDVRRRIEASHGALLHAAPVDGGCISNTAKLSFASGKAAFLKWAPATQHAPELFVEEARSLRAIADTRTARVPKVIAEEKTADYAWLILEWLDPGPRTARSQSMLGEQLAAMHKNSSSAFGWPSDNFIGTLLQSNRRHDRWCDFWRDERLRPQIELADHKLVK